MLIYTLYGTDISYFLKKKNKVTLLANRYPFRHTISAHLQQSLLSGEPKAEIQRVNITDVDLRMKTFTKNLLVLNKTLTSQGNLFQGLNLERAASMFTINRFATAENVVTKQSVYLREIHLKHKTSIELHVCDYTVMLMFRLGV